MSSPTAPARPESALERPAITGPGGVGVRGTPRPRGGIQPRRRSQPPARRGERRDPYEIVPPGQTLPGRPAREMGPQQAQAYLTEMGVMGQGVTEAGRHHRERYPAIAHPVCITFPLVVHIPGPPAGQVTFEYAGRNRRSGELEPNPQVRHNVIDVRLAALLVRTAVYAHQQGVRRIFHVGTGEGFRDPHLDHGRGMAIDINGFEVVNASGEREIIDPLFDWRLGRSSYGGAHSADRLPRRDARRALVPEAGATMSPQEALLRNFWGFWLNECVHPPGVVGPRAVGDLFTPSHNSRHHNHYHVGLPLRGPGAS